MFECEVYYDFTRRKKELYHILRGKVGMVKWGKILHVGWKNKLIFYTYECLYVRKHINMTIWTIWKKYSAGILCTRMALHKDTWKNFKNLNVNFNVFLSLIIFFQNLMIIILIRECISLI